MTAGRDLQLHMIEVTRLDMCKSKQCFFEQGDRNGSFLALLAQHDTPPTIITEIKTNRRASVVTSLNDIFTEFSSFNCSLHMFSLSLNYKQNPTVLIKLGGHPSESFTPQGHAEGLPSRSPALFAIAMEPIAETLCSSQEMKGLHISWLEESDPAHQQSAPFS